ncbi:cation/H(+) antiporter 4-like [Mangifera indica]|uniref:cation/H(+) antiporter 4-like n=1 Tax=Mangifera indica TaxID=29780 RepID=UPI001CF94791|nr:cation/H(+) antiporter 4-like [Mangifera indica]
MAAEGTLNQTKICLTLPPKIQSSGLWKGLALGGKLDWFSFGLPRLELFIAIIFVITHFSHSILKRSGLPMFISQLITGLLLSPAVIGKTTADKMFTEEVVQVLTTLGSFGYAFFFFLIGVKTNPGMVTKVAKRAFFIGLLAVTIPLLSAIMIPHLFTLKDQDKIELLFLSPPYAMTAFPVIYCLLSELKILNSELGRIALSSAIVSDLLGLFFAVSTTLLRVALQKDIRTAMYDLVYVIAFISFLFLVLRPGIKYVITYIPEGQPVNQIFISIILLCFLMCLSLTRWFGDFFLLGVYVFGLAIPDGPPLGSDLVDKTETMVKNLLLPIFVTTCGMRIETLLIRFDDHFTSLNALTAAVALLVKFLVCLLPPLYCKMPNYDAVALALIMSCKGFVEMAIFSFLFDSKIIDEQTYCFMFYIVIYTASVVPAMVKLLYDPSRKYAGYQNRSIMAAKPNTELEIVACIHVPDNVSAVINLLDVAFPSQDNLMSVNVLHLVKLSGQASPIFISHQKKKKDLANHSYSENVIISFTKFQGIYWGALSVNTFTAVSPPNLMHDDICTLALDKLASLIILPFHRRWYIDGSIESEDEIIRTLNSRVLEKSPCSVGILIDRGNIRRPVVDPLSEPEYNVGVIFLGGPDDREVLSFAKRIAPNTRVNLSVLHFTAEKSDDCDSEEWEKTIDNVSLRDIKTNGYINYMQYAVKDGPETTMIIRSVISEYNLMIVGRRENLDSKQTSGLKEWTEFPELGVLGDLLVSMDVGRCSVLVVQQQQTS